MDTGKLFLGKHHKVETMKVIRQEEEEQGSAPLTDMKGFKEVATQSI